MSTETTTTCDGCGREQPPNEAWMEVWPPNDDSQDYCPKCAGKINQAIADLADTPEPAMKVLIVEECDHPNVRPNGHCEDCDQYVRLVPSEDFTAEEGAEE